MRTFLLGLLLAGCAPQYFVSDVHHAGGDLVVTKCMFDADGKPTRICHDEAGDSGDDLGGDETVNAPPTAAELRAVKRQLDAQNAEVARDEARARAGS